MLTETFFSIVSILTFLLLPSVKADTAIQYEANINFYLFNTTYPTLRQNSTFNNITNQCDSNGNYAIIVHGWTESYNSGWVYAMIQNYLTYRGGCVVFMDYSYYSVLAYGTLVNHFAGISAVLLKMVQQIGNYDQQYLFGFSFGCRLVIDVGLKVGNQILPRIDVCDCAGPGFSNFLDPKPAAKNILCVDTSIDKGTSVYNCHQNFLMGNCGKTQPAAGLPPMGSHGLCPWNSAFIHNFVPNNYYKCSSPTMIKNVTSDVMVGYNASFNRTANRGIIYIATAKHSPYVVVNGTIATN